MPNILYSQSLKLPSELPGCKTNGDSTRVYILSDEMSTSSQHCRNLKGGGYITHLEVVYALPEHQYIRVLSLPNNSTVLQAIVASGITKLRTDIDLKNNKVGIYGRLVKLSDLINEGDRIEIYRPLIADPKELRRRRADKSKKSSINF